MKRVSSSSAPVRTDAPAAVVSRIPVPTVHLEVEQPQPVFEAGSLAPASLDPSSLSGMLHDFIMPRLRDPSILRIERRRRVLTGLIHKLERDMDGPNADALTRGGVQTLRHELRGLDLVRGNRDSLIQG